MTRERIRLLTNIIIGLTILQLVRIALKLAVFCFLQRTMASDDIVTALLMTAITLIGLGISKKKGIQLSVFPKSHTGVYIIVTVFYLALLVFTPVITGNSSCFAIFTLIYSSVITPVFEELLFRGYVWNRLKRQFHKESAVYIISTLLFALWHLGYADSVAFRLTTENLAFIMLMKAVTGLIFGIVLGALRTKTKNCYSAIILHGAMNIFGR